MILSTLLGVVCSASAQELAVPVSSPRATVSQQIGTATVSVDYGSPAARDRPIFGSLVPHGALWRTGANQSTVFESSADLVVGGKPVPAGKYGVFTIPGETSWTVILSTNTERWGTYAYDEAEEWARFEVTPIEAPARERLTFLFADTTEHSTTLQLEWGGLGVPISIETDSDTRAVAAIDSYVASAARQLANGALYLGNHGDIEGGLELVDQSLELKESAFALWVRTSLLKKKGDDKAAYKALVATRAFASQQRGRFWYFFEDRLDRWIAEWPRK